MLTCLASFTAVDSLLNVLFEETTALGSAQEVTRHILPRRFTSVKIRGGTVRIKIAAVDHTSSKAAPEFIDCADSRTHGPSREDGIGRGDIGLCEDPSAAKDRP